MFRVRTVTTGVAGTPWYNNFYFNATDVATNGPIAVADVGLFWDALDGLIDNACLMHTEEVVAVIDPSTGNITDELTTAGDTESGDSAASPLPYSVAALIGWKTGVFAGGRQIQGRTFISGFTNDTTGSTGLFVSGAFTGLEAAASVLEGSVAGLCVWSRKNGAAYPVNGHSIPLQPSVMRSRRD